MFVRTVVAVTLFTSLAGATDIFSVRSFTDPKTKAKIPVTGQLFSSPKPEELLKQTAKDAAARGNGECAIPLLEARTSKTGDQLSRPNGSNPDPGSVVKAPMAACKGWN